jgi:ATP-dependent Clp protease protease subunit
MIKLIFITGLALVSFATIATFRPNPNAGTVGASTVTLTDTGKATTASATATTTGVTNKAIVKKSTTLKELNLDDSRQVYVYGVIDETTAPQVAQQILELGKDPSPINVLINSPGGSVLDGAEIISAMQAAKGPVNTVCVQICASMAAMIHSYGTKRLMIDRSFVMFHPATGGVEGEVDKMYSRLGSLKEYIGDMELNAANRAGMSYDDYKFHSGVEMWLSSRNAIKNGFADDIVFVRGSEANKLFLNTQQTMKYVNKKLPFVMYPNGSFTQPNNGKFYWISPSAYKMLYGDTVGTANGR